jgi:phosphoglycolate phosphatase
LGDALSYLLPALPKERYAHLAERYRFHFVAGEHTLMLFAGARHALEHLRSQGYRLAVATGKTRQGLQRALETNSLAGLFHATRCADEGAPKPHPEMLLYLMDALRASPHRTLMIGDTSHDLDMARAAQVPAVALTHGAHSEASLRACAPLACVASFADLLEWLRAED